MSMFQYKVPVTIVVIHSNRKHSFIWFKLQSDILHLLFTFESVRLSKVQVGGLQLEYTRWLACQETFRSYSDKTLDFFYMGFPSPLFLKSRQFLS